MSDRFEGSFTQQEPIPDDSIAAALEVLQHGRLHRYNQADGEQSQTAFLEQEFAKTTGAKYALAVTSGGYAIGCALRAIGVKPGDPVLSNGFTLAPVPGAIASLGADPVFVDITDNLTIDLDDLQAKIESSGARVLLLSHMRGHLCDMSALMDICNAAQVVVIEDCAHTMGAHYDGVPSGRHGLIGCYSTQTYKHINSGEGGFLVCDDPDAMARAIILSGSYMLYERHAAAPPPEAFEQIKWVTPNISGRMDNLRAAILRPQLRALGDQVARWNARYTALEEVLRSVPEITLIARDPRGVFVGSSFQFRLTHMGPDEIDHFTARCAVRGVELKWFGAPEPKGFTSRYDSWRYARPQSLANTDRILAGLIDMRLPLTFSLGDCARLGQIIAEEARMRSDGVAIAG